MIRSTAWSNRPGLKKFALCGRGRSFVSGPVSVLEAELRSAEASRRLGALDLRMSGVQGGLGEHKRDILKLREAGIPCSQAPKQQRYLQTVQGSEWADREECVA